MIDIALSSKSFILYFTSSNNGQSHKTNPVKNWQAITALPYVSFVGLVMLYGDSLFLIVRFISKRKKGGKLTKNGAFAQPFPPGFAGLRSSLISKSQYFLYVKKQS